MRRIDTRRAIFLSAAALCCSGCVYTRLFYFQTPTLAAPHYFDNRTVHASPNPLPVPKSRDEARFTLTAKERTRYRTLDRLLESQGTRAFVVIHDDGVVYERYFHGVSASTELPAFSMSKTYAAVLVGRAIAEGVLPPLDAHVVDYVPELSRRSGYGDVTLEELLRMTSGIDFDETSLAGPLFYYTTNLRGMMYEYDVEWRPGTHYLYGSVNVQLLWDVLHRRLGGETVSRYFETEVWAPLGAVSDASWSLDSDASGIEKFFGGFNATARDHARLGLLFLHDGAVNGRQLLSKEWIARSLAPDPVPGRIHTTDGWVRRGEFQWFLTEDRRAFFAKGYRGQYIFVVPDEDAVFVRFGEGYGDVDWPSLFRRLAEQLRRPALATAGRAPAPVPPNERPATAAALLRATPRRSEARTRPP
ncbi:MAG TPA: serine hydrolase [Polyangiaceae bacterium]|nr:serine hydrolase [Polyangiaceae bacterium]